MGRGWNPCSGVWSEPLTSLKESFGVIHIVNNRDIYVKSVKIAIHQVSVYRVPGKASLLPMGFVNLPTKIALFTVGCSNCLYLCILYLSPCQVHLRDHPLETVTSKAIIILCII